jgi:hypothetical protein
VFLKGQARRKLNFPTRTSPEQVSIVFTIWFQVRAQPASCLILRLVYLISNRSMSKLQRANYGKLEEIPREQCSALTQIIRLTSPIRKQPMILLHS